MSKETLNESTPDDPARPAWEETPVVDAPRPVPPTPRFVEPADEAPTLPREPAPLEWVDNPVAAVSLYPDEAPPAPSAAEWRRLSAELRRLSAQIAHARA